MNPETKLIPRPSNRQQVANITDVLAQMQRSGSMHFVKSLPGTAFETSSVTKTAKLSLPTQFVQENKAKIEEWVILRAHSSCGRSSRPWLVRLSVSVRPREVAEVQIVGGWSDFVADNRLKKGDYLIFLLKEDARSEFEVYMFRGLWGSPYFPNEGESSDSEKEDNVSDSDEEENVSYSEEEHNVSDSEEEEENTNHQPRLPSPVHQQEDHNQAFSRAIREGNPAPLQHTESPRVHPGFSKRLAIYNIGRSTGQNFSGQFELPRDFIRTYGEQVHESLILQGIHENSPDYAITCRRRPGDVLKAYFFPGEWSKFVQDNGLKVHFYFDV